ncbi:hypothetical protein L1887_11754 [Cichorium endivia]|nr:hypothetical protein L1887_11754 [Cichorium endivia]
MEIEPPLYGMNYYGSSPHYSKRKASTELESTASKRFKYATDIEMWRKHLGIPSIKETGESSGGSYYLPLTGETVEDTVPLLVGQTIFLEDQHMALMDYYYEVVADLEVLKERSQNEEKEAQISRDAIMDLHDHLDEHIVALAAHQGQFVDLAYEQRILGDRMLIEEARSNLVEAELSTIQDQVHEIIDLLHRHFLC